MSFNRWRHSVWSANAKSCTYTGLSISQMQKYPPVMDFIRRRHLSVFGHIAQLTQGTPAHNALHCQVGLAFGRSLGRDWRRLLVVLACAGLTNPATTLYLFLPISGDRQAILRGHDGATRWPELATQWRRRRRTVHLLDTPGLGSFSTLT